jgi:predicted Ser/Thr protein kinase
VVQTGDILVGRYDIGTLLGRGGMGSVFAGFDRTLGREVAVKVLAAERVEDGVFVERFDREARAAASLSHRNVVAVFDSGAQDGTPFIVMERVSGRTLSALIREGPLPVARAAEIAVSVAEALGAAHVRGIVHRDVKPGNVMVAADGQVKVLDFGIARALNATSLTYTATVIGTASYLSPEQAAGAPVDARSDVYGLGCVLYEMLTGRPPFLADAAAGVVHQHLTRPPAPPAELRPEVTAGLQEVVLRCLAKEPGRRYVSAEELCGALRACSASVGAPARTELQTEATRVLEPAAGRPRRRNRMAALAGALLLGAVGLALVLDLASSGSGARRSASTKPAASVKPARAGASAAKAPPHPSTAAGAATAPASTAAALTVLILGDQQRGLIEPSAAQAILHRSAELLQAYSSGNAENAARRLAELDSQIEALGASGAITSPSAAAGLKASVAALAGALSASPPTGAQASVPAGPDAGKRKGHGHKAGGGSQD